MVDARCSHSCSAGTTSSSSSSTTSARSRKRRSGRIRKSCDGTSQDQGLVEVEGCVCSPLDANQRRTSQVKASQEKFEESNDVDLSSQSLDSSVDGSNSQRKWWSRLPGVDPITLEPIKKLGTPPFKLKADKGSRVVYYFDAEVLSHYLVSTGQFCHPISRRPLLRKECGALDSHLKECGLEGQATVRKKFDEVVRIQKEEENRRRLEVETPSADEQNRIRDEEARELLEQLYIEGPTVRLQERRPIATERSSSDEHARSFDCQEWEDFPELSTGSRTMSAWPTLAQPELMTGTSTHAATSSWPSLHDKRTNDRQEQNFTSGSSTFLRPCVSSGQRRQIHGETKYFSISSANIQPQADYSSRVLQTALSDPYRAYKLEEEIDLFSQSGKKRHKLAPADRQWREVGHVLCSVRGLTSCSLGHGLNRGIQIFSNSIVKQPTESLRDAMRKAYDCARLTNGESSIENEGLKDCQQDSEDKSQLMDETVGIVDNSSLEGKQAFSSTSCYLLPTATSNTSYLHVSSGDKGKREVPLDSCSSPADDSWNNAEITSQRNHLQTQQHLLAFESWEEMADPCPGLWILPALPCSTNTWQALESETHV